MSQSGLQPGAIVLGKLRVIRLLGTGGLGAVYEVEHSLTQHRRALKLLHLQHQNNDQVVQRFLREASAAGRIGNPHIVECFDAGRLPSGEPYLVMELLQGRSLADLLQEAGRLEPDVAVGLARQACQALSAAHRAGIIHRDLKPENLFITGLPAQPFLKVLDFGISKFDPTLTSTASITQAGITMGTPVYMPPEQWRGAGEVDARSDIYALGVVLYECLAGSVPYSAEGLPGLAVLVAQGEAPPLALRRPSLPAGLAAVVHRAFSVEPAERFQTADAFHEALEAFVAPGVARGHDVARRRDGSTPVDSNTATLPPLATELLGTLTDAPHTESRSASTEPPDSAPRTPPSAGSNLARRRRRVTVGAIGVGGALLVLASVLWPSGTPEVAARKAFIALVDDRLDQVLQCGPQTGRPGTRGTVTLRFTVTKDGRLRDVEVADDTLGDGAGACLKRLIGAWELPFRPDNEVSIDYRFRFWFEH